MSCMQARSQAKKQSRDEQIDRLKKRYRETTENRMLRLISSRYLGVEYLNLKDVGLCVYFIFDGEYIKIGIAESVERRLKELQTANARKLKILYVIQAQNPIVAQRLERLLHKYFKDKQVMGEWFCIDDRDIKRATTELNLRLAKTDKFPDDETRRPKHQS